MIDFGSFHTNAFSDQSPEDYNFGSTNSQYCPPLILSPADPPTLAPDFGHLLPSLGSSYNHTHVRPPQPRIDTSPHLYQSSSLIDQTYNDVLGIPYSSPGLTPDSSCLPTPEHSPDFHRHVNIVTISHSPMSPSIPAYERTVRLACTGCASLLLILRLAHPRVPFESQTRPSNGIRASKRTLIACRWYASPPEDVSSQHAERPASIRRRGSARAAHYVLHAEPLPIGDVSSGRPARPVHESLRQR